MEMEHYVSKHRFAINPHLKSHVLIVNLIDFDHPSIGKRRGADCDEWALKILFENYLNCKDVQVVNRATESELLDPTSGLISQLINKCLRNCSLCVFAIMTHGNSQDMLVLSDGTQISKNEILDCFSTERCEELKNVPKLFLLTFCRGDGLEQYDKCLAKHWSMVQRNASPSLNLNRSGSEPIVVEIDQTPMLHERRISVQPNIVNMEPNMSEYCIIYSTDEGYPSLRTEYGTTFMRIFCQVLTKFYQFEHFAEMTTRVRRHMSSVATVVNLEQVKGKREKNVNFRIPCTIVPYFNYSLYFVAKPRRLTMEEEDKLDEEMETFMIESFGPVQPAIVREVVVEADSSSGGRTLSFINEIKHEVESAHFDYPENQRGPSMDNCIFVRLLFKRTIFANGYRNKYSFVFRDKTEEYPIYSYGIPGATLYDKLQEGRCYLIYDTCMMNATPVTSIGRATVHIVMKPDCIREAQVNEGQTIFQQIPTYISYLFTPLCEVAIATTDKDNARCDVIGRFIQYDMDTDRYKGNYADTIYLIGPEESKVKVRVWNDYRQAIPNLGDVVAIRQAKLNKGNIPGILNVNMESFIEKIERPEQLPPSQMQFLREIP